MKNGLKAIGSAVLYALLFSMAHAAVSTIAAICCAAADLVRYPALKSIAPEKAVELLCKLSLNHWKDYSAWTLLLGSFAALGVIWLIFRTRKKCLRQEVCLHRVSGKDLAIAAVIGCTVPVCISLINALIPYPEEILQDYDSHASLLPQANGLIPFLAIAVVGPFAEEVFYRGLIYGRLKKGMGTVSAIVLSAVFFGAGHSGILWFSSAFLAGLLLAWVFETTHSLWPCILIHILNNGLPDLLNQAAELPDWAVVVSPVLLIASIVLLAKKYRCSTG